MRPFPTLVLSVVTALILTVTLFPATGETGYIPVTCIFCGEHATSDALSNVILFFPLGFALAWWRPGTKAWRLGPLLSLAIEVAQRFIAGRDASVGDVLTNTAGTLLGWVAWRYVMGGAQRPAPREWPWAAAAFAAVVAATVWLMQPAPTAATYFPMWTPVLGHFEWYRGRVLGARLDADSLLPRPLADATPVREFVLGHRALHVRFIAGKYTMRLAPIVAVFDVNRQELMLLGVDGGELVVRHRRHTSGWRLDGPDARFPKVAARWTPGDTIALSVSRTARATCLKLRDATRCIPGVTPGMAWSLVLYPESLPKAIHAALSLLWPCGLMMLLGWCAGTRRAALASGGVGLVALWLLPLLIAGAPSPPAEMIAAIAGLPLGVAAALDRAAGSAGDELGEHRDAAVDAIVRCREYRTRLIHRIGDRPSAIADRIEVPQNDDRARGWEPAAQGFDLRRLHHTHQLRAADLVQRQHGRAMLAQIDAARGRFVNRESWRRPVRSDEPRGAHVNDTRGTGTELRA